MSHSPDMSKLLLGIEACRPGSDDIDAPQFAEELGDAARAIASDEQAELLYTRIQQSDTAVAKAFHDVDVPTRLQDRLLAALEADAGSEDSVATDEGDGAAERPSPKSVATPASLSPLIGSPTLIGGALAASVLVASVIGYRLWNQPSAAGLDEVVASATQLHSEVTTDQLTSVGGALPDERPASDRMRRDLNSVGWAKVAGLGDESAVAYRYRQQRGGEATLMVFRPKTIDANLPLAPPLNPAHSSGVTVGVWTSGGLVYALVVDGGVQQYQGFIRSSSVASLISSQHQDGRSA